MGRQFMLKYENCDLLNKQKQREQGYNIKVCTIIFLDEINCTMFLLYIILNI